MKLLNSHSSTNVYSENISGSGKNRWLVEGLQLFLNKERVEEIRRDLHRCTSSLLGHVESLNKYFTYVSRRNC